MKSLLRRELRRLAPYAAGITVFVSLVIVAGLGMKFMTGTSSVYLWIGLIPGVLGIATVAPDTASGGTAFLTRMPLDPGRVLLAKLLAAGVWTLLGAGVALLALAASSGMADLVNHSLGWPYLVLCLGAGLLGSVLANKTMPALLLAPGILILVGLVGVLLPIVFMRIEGKAFWELGIGVLGAFLLAASFLAYVRGERHRSSARPALIALAVLAPMLGLWTAGLAVARSLTLDRAVPEMRVGPGTAGSERHLAIPVEGDRWSGYERRVVVVDRMDRSGWVVPTRDVYAPQFSPDGRWLLLRKWWAAGGCLVDVEARTVEELAGGHGREGLGYRHVLWRVHGPLLIELRDGRLDVFDPRGQWIQQVIISRDWTLVGTDPDGRALVSSDTGLRAYTNLGDWPDPPNTRPVGRKRWTGTPVYRRKAKDLEQVLTTEELISWPAERRYTSMILSPTGRYVLAVKSGDDHLPEVLDVRTGRRILVKGLARTDPRRLKEASRRTLQIQGDLLWERKNPAPRLKSFVHGFSPDGRHLLLERMGGGAAIVDLESGLVRLFQPRPVSAMGAPIVWSPDGRYAALPSGIVVDVDTGTIQERAKLAVHPGGAIAGFLTPDLMVPFGQPLNLYDRKSGQVVLPARGVLEGGEQ